jgi:arylsulfatase A-like enzyme
MLEHKARRSPSALWQCMIWGVAGVVWSGCSMQSSPRSADTRAQGSRPNVIFIFDDQLRADAVGAYGGRNIRTPHMDRLAEQGTLFASALSTCPLCTPYRGMLQTGRYPTHSGLVLNWVEVNPNQRCIAHVFGEAGYETGFIGKWHLAAGVRKKTVKFMMTREQKQENEKRQRAYAQENPETEYVPPGPARLGYAHWQAYNFHSSFTNYYYYEDTPQRLKAPGFETDIQFDQAIAFIDEQKEVGRPFFLMIAPHPPHPPFKPETCPPGYLEKVPEELAWAPNVPEDHRRREDPLEVRCYYAMVKNFDDNLGRLMDSLDRSGLSDDTILVVTADHGDMHGSHGRENKMVPDREAVHIPLIVRWPGHIPAGRRVEVLQTPMDHLPTLCGLAGLEAPATCDGMDLSATLLGGKEIERDAVLMMNYVSHWDYFDTGTVWPEWRGVRTPRYTYVKWLTGDEELYDNVADPYQMKNVVADPGNDAVVKKLRARLAELLADAHDEFLPGTAYAEWYDDERNLIRTGLGPVERRP